MTLGCGVDNGIGGTNRLLDITGLEMDTILPPYIYNACEVRITDAIDEIDLDAAYFMARPNPFNNMTTIAFNNRKGESFLLNFRTQLIPKRDQWQALRAQYSTAPAQ